MRTFKLSTKYCTEEATVKFGHYANKEVALMFRTLDGQPLITATVNLQAYGEAPVRGNVFIKSWAENQGTYASLLALGIIGKYVRRVDINNDLTAYECPLLITCQEGEAL